MACGMTNAMSGFSNPQIIGGLVTLLLATYAAFFAWIVRRFERLETKLETKIDRLDEKFSTKLENLTVAVSRLEGAVYHAPLSERRSAGGEV
jgi:hypothetical protein